MLAGRQTTGIGRLAGETINGLSSSGLIVQVPGRVIALGERDLSTAVGQLACRIQSIAEEILSPLCVGLGKIIQTIDVVGLSILENIFARYEKTRQERFVHHRVFYQPSLRIRLILSVGVSISINVLSKEFVVAFYAYHPNRCCGSSSSKFVLWIM